MQAGRESLQRQSPLANPLPWGDDVTQRATAEREGDIRVHKKNLSANPLLPPLEFWTIASSAILRGKLKSFERPLVRSQHARQKLIAEKKIGSDVLAGEKSFASGCPKDAKLSPLPERCIAHTPKKSLKSSSWWTRLAARVHALGSVENLASSTSNVNNNC